MSRLSWISKKRVATTTICMIIVASSIILLQNGQVTEAILLEPHPGLVGWWRFDEGTGILVEDSSINNNYGTLYGDASWIIGKHGEAISFNGIDNKLDCSNSLIDPTVFTLSAWIKPITGINGHQNIISRGPGSNLGGWELKIVGLNLQIGTSFVDQWRTIDKSNAIVAEEWQMVTGVWNGTHLQLYVNGNIVAQSGDLGSYTRKLSTSKIWIGAWTGLSNFFSGAIDDARIYNKALSSTKIEELFHEGPDFSSNLLAKIPKGTNKLVVTLSWQGIGNINATVESPHEIYIEESLPIYQKTSYSSNDCSQLHIKRISISVDALLLDENWNIFLEYENVKEYKVIIEIQK